MNFCDLEGIFNYNILRDYAHLRASGIVKHFSFWAQESLRQVFVFIRLVHVYALPFSGLDERHFFPSLFLVGTVLYCHKSMCHVCLRSQPHCFSLVACAGISPAGRLPQQFTTPGGCSLARNVSSPPAWTAEGMGGVCAPFTLSPETVLVIVRQARGMLSRSIDIVRPTWVSVRFPQAQLGNKGTDLLEMYTNQKLLC